MKNARWPGPGYLSIAPFFLLAFLFADSDTSELTGLTGWIADVMEAMGEAGVGALVLLETVFPPIPSEVALLLAGFLAGQGSMSLVGVIISATIGSVAGSLLLYGAGAALGRTRFYRIVEWMPLVETSDIEVAERWFNRYGYQAVFFGRLVPLVRSGISVPAGLTRMPLGPFVLYTALGSGIWNTLFVLLGYAVGDQWKDVGRYSDWFNNAILVGIVLGVIWYVYRHIRRRSQRTSPSRL